MDKKLAVLEYQNNFADNFTTYAYGKILEKKFSYNCVCENSINDRKKFENLMNNFNINYSFIPSPHAQKIIKKSLFMDYSDLTKHALEKDRAIKKSDFRIEDRKYLTSEIKSMFDFKNTDFINNYDILEEIISSNSIGLYVNPDDEIDFEYINKALLRLNKYLKKPKLYVFSGAKIDEDFVISPQHLTLKDWREEFYFLKNCRHKIIYCTKKSYSEGFWASVLAEYKNSYIIYSKSLKQKAPDNYWIAI